MLLVGGGLTAAAIHFLLKQSHPSLAIEVWEKSATLGGRMASHASHKGCRVDLGAQYLTAHSGVKFSHWYELLVTKGLIEPLCGTIEGTRSDHHTKLHFVPKLSMQSVVESLLNDANAVTNRQLLRLDFHDDSQLWRATFSDSGRHSCQLSYRDVMLCIPAPQLIAIEGNWRDSLNEGDWERLASVQYSSRFVFALYLKTEAPFSPPWMAKYVYDDPIARYVSFESLKYSSHSSEETAVLIHSTVQSVDIIRDMDNAALQQSLLDSLRRILPELRDAQLSECHSHFWSPSQAIAPISEAANGAPVLFVKRAGGATLTLAGDYFSQSNFEGCLESAEAAVAKLTAEKDEGECGEQR